MSGQLGEIKGSKDAIGFVKFDMPSRKFVFSKTIKYSRYVGTQIGICGQKYYFEINKSAEEVEIAFLGDDFEDPLWNIVTQHYYRFRFGIKLQWFRYVDANDYGVVIIEGNPDALVDRAAIFLSNIVLKQLDQSSEN